MIKAKHLLNICKENKPVYSSEIAKQTAELSVNYLTELIKAYGEDYDLYSVLPCKFDLEQSNQKVASIIKHTDWEGEPMDKWEVVVYDKGPNGKYGLTYKDTQIIHAVFSIISMFEDASNFVPSFAKDDE